MKVHISGTMKYQTEAEADSFMTTITNQVGSNIVKLRKDDTEEAKQAGIFPESWAVYFMASWTGREFLTVLSKLTVFLNNNQSDIFNFSCNSSHELEP